MALKILNKYSTKVLKGVLAHIADKSFNKPLSKDALILEIDLGVNGEQLRNLLQLELELRGV